MSEWRMKGVVIYDTSYGNTRKIEETIAETLKASGMDVNLFDVNNVKKLSSSLRHGKFGEH